ncbi:MAG: hypothetical protein ACO3UU_16785 [Minisyncoccia bacterium]
MKTLSITLYNRPRYTKVLFDHLDICYNIDQYKVFIYCEPDQEETIRLAKGFRPHQTNLTINPYKFGCNKNVFQAIDNGFSINDYHIHLEDDTIPAKDFLIYCEWANHRYLHHNHIFSVSGYVNSNNKIEQYIEKNTNYDCVGVRKWFTPWGWATWSNRWREIKDRMSAMANDSITISWDYALHCIIGSYELLEVFPLVSRIQNIGAENGSFCPGTEWHRTNQYNDYWIESDKNYQQNFREI